MIAHELRGPTSAFKDLTKKVNYLIQKEDYQKLNQYGQYFETSGQKLFLQLDNLLSWVMLQKGRIRVMTSQFSFAEVIQDILTDLNYLIEERNITIHSPITIPYQVYSDRNVLKIIVRNIIENACKNAPQNSIVTIKTFLKDKQLVLEVSNGGQGIDLEMVAALRSGTIIKKALQHRGHGMGLQICFHFAKMLDIKLDFQNKKADGTSVQIIVPHDERSHNPSARAAALAASMV